MGAITTRHRNGLASLPALVRHQTDEPKPRAELQSLAERARAGLPLFPTTEEDGQTVDPDAVLAASRPRRSQARPAPAVGPHVRVWTKPMPLSPREREVLMAFGNGLKINQISMCLEISRGTVMAHLDRAKFKLGLDTRHALLCHAIRLSMQTAENGGAA